LCGEERILGDQRVGELVLNMGTLSTAARGNLRPPT
jgi:hypothetical protein